MQVARRLPPTSSTQQEQLEQIIKALRLALTWLDGHPLRKVCQMLGMLIAIAAGVYARQYALCETQHTQGSHMLLPDSQQLIVVLDGHFMIWSAC
jgi:hypothetical protein